jgi:hypothetical protein
MAARKKVALPPRQRNDGVVEVTQARHFGAVVNQLPVFQRKQSDDAPDAASGIDEMT